MDNSSQGYDGHLGSSVHLRRYRNRQRKIMVGGTVDLVS